jgi:hypothetical protein
LLGCLPAPAAQQAGRACPWGCRCNCSSDLTCTSMSMQTSKRGRTRSEGLGPSERSRVGSQWVAGPPAGGPGRGAVSHPPVRVRSLSSPSSWRGCTRVQIVVRPRPTSRDGSCRVCVAGTCALLCGRGLSPWEGGQPLWRRATLCTTSHPHRWPWLPTGSSPPAAPAPSGVRSPAPRRWTRGPACVPARSVRSTAGLGGRAVQPRWCRGAGHRARLACQQQGTHIFTADVDVVALLGIVLLVVCKVGGAPAASGERGRPCKCQPMRTTRTAVLQRGLSPTRRRALTALCEPHLRAISAWASRRAVGCRPFCGGSTSVSPCSTARCRLRLMAGCCTYSCSLATGLRSPGTAQITGRKAGWWEHGRPAKTPRRDWWADWEVDWRRGQRQGPDSCPLKPRVTTSDGE